MHFVVEPSLTQMQSFLLIAFESIGFGNTILNGTSAAASERVTLRALAAEAGGTGIIGPVVEENEL